MKEVQKRILEELRQQFPAGTRVQLDEMDDMQAPPVGALGTVIGVDDTGSIMVRWDTGGSLHVLYGIDRCHKISEPEA